MEGHTNRQIGENLYITGKTVESHVTNILAKLQVDTAPRSPRSPAGAT